MPAISGDARLNGGELLRVDHLAVFRNDGEEIIVNAEEDSVLLVTSGEPLNEPIASYGPFLMNTQEEVVRAIEVWKSGKLNKREREMISIRRTDDRGHANHGWLDTHFTFSFADYYDPRFMGFRDLRVINEDFVAPDQGFPKHGHRDMEIVTYVISGELSHRDSMGNGETIFPNEVQRMTAGTGVLHSEYSSPTERTHLLQIWILPEKPNLTPGYEQKKFPAGDKSGRLKLIASRGGDDGSVHINQDVKIYASILTVDENLTIDLAADRHAWIQLISGAIDVNGFTLNAGDGAAISDESHLKIWSHEDNSEFLLFDLN